MSKPHNASDIFNPAHKKPIQRWYRDVAIRQQSHSELSESYDGKERYLSTWAVGLNAVASSVIFTTVNPNESDSDKARSTILAVFAGIIAAINTILQAITKHLQYAQAAEQHQQAFRQFTQMRLRLESIFGNHYYDDKHIDRIHFNEWIKEYRDLLESSPLIPQNVFLEKAAKEDAAWKIQSANTTVTEETKLLNLAEHDESYGTEDS